jgi:hypothetical protein
MQAPREMAAHQRAVLAFDLDPAIVQLDETVDERKAKSGAGALPRAAEKRSKTLALTSGAMPGPVSATEICTSSPTIAPLSVIVPPPGVYLRALERRLKTTC